MTRRSRHVIVLVIWSLLLLSIGIGQPWELVHEDNGAMHTTLALSHVREGVAETRAHNWFVPRDGGEWIPYPHHPATVPLLIAGAFTLTGSETPAVSRAVMILFSIGGVLTMYAILAMLFADLGVALAGALFFATVPMQSFFGRMVNYEPPTLFFVLLMLAAYVRFRLRGSNGDLVLAAAAAFAGVMIDWTILFFCGAVVVAEVVDMVKNRSSWRARMRVILTIGLGAAAGMAVSFGHIFFAFGSFERFFGVLGRDVGVGHEPLRIGNFLMLQIENFRHYFTTSGVIIAIVAAVAALFPATRAGRALLGDRPQLRRFLLIAGAAALAYILVSPNRARLHHYWQFYFLPFAAAAFAAVWAQLWGAAQWGAGGLAGERRKPRSLILLILVVVEVTAATSYKLYRRHTEPGEYAVGAIRETERLFLAP